MLDALETDIARLIASPHRPETSAVVQAVRADLWRLASRHGQDAETPDLGENAEAQVTRLITALFLVSCDPELCALVRLHREMAHEALCYPDDACVTADSFLKQARACVSALGVDY